MDVPGCSISHHTVYATDPADVQSTISWKRSAAAQGSETPLADATFGSAAMTAKDGAEPDPMNHSSNSPKKAPIRAPIRTRPAREG
jgi:hypothetical protein